MPHGKRIWINENKSYEACHISRREFVDFQNHIEQKFGDFNDILKQILV